LPKFDLDSIGINDPKERAVLLLLWFLMYRNSSGVELTDHFVHTVDSIVNHEGLFTWTEPFCGRLSDVPCRNTLIFCFILGPPKGGAAPLCKLKAEMLLVPFAQSFIVGFRFKEYAADSGYFCHSRLLIPFHFLLGKI